MLRRLFLIGFLLFLFPLCASAELNPLLETHAKYGSIKVVQVISTDTITLETGEHVSLIGIKGAPPPKFEDVKRDGHGFIVHDDDPTTTFEVEVFRFAKGFLEGKVVRLEFDVERRDEDSVLEAYVFLPDGTMANEEFLRRGYAELKLQTPNMKYAQKLRVAYQEARREMRGMQGQW